MTTTKHMPNDLQTLTKVSARLEHDGAVLRLELNSPPGNVLDTEMILDLRHALAATREMLDLKLLIFTGAGKHFSFGVSVEEHRPDQVRKMFAGFHGLFRDLLRSSIPTLALVRGHCLGGGLELAAFCDWVHASEESKLGQPEIQLGVFAPMGSLLLPWRCPGNSADLLLTGKSVDAVEALSMGLVDELLPETDGELMLERWIRDEILPLSASSLRRARRASRWALHKMLETGLDDLEHLYFQDLMKTRDAVEGVQAFLEKREPVWTND